METRWMVVFRRCVVLCVVLSSTLVSLHAGAIHDGSVFRRGDANADGGVDVTDAVYLLNYLFLGERAPSCAKSGDADDSGTLELTDALYTVNFLFLGGPAPAAPGAWACGPDSTLDSLPCSSYDAECHGIDADWSGLLGRPSNPQCFFLAPPGASDRVALVNAYPELDLERTLTALRKAPGDSSRWYALERWGRVLSFEDRSDVGASEVVLDIRDRVLEPNDGGLLDLAFHPEFERNGKAYLFYTGEGNPHEVRISLFRSHDEGATFRKNSEERILSVGMPSSVHAGGRLAFGPDGFLYIGIGDTDEGWKAQQRSSLKGSMVRIDVDSGDPYGIPRDNPYATKSGRPEIYAIGFRNPYRWSFDRQTGELWLADVGKTCWEEINLVERGGNYGWDERDGYYCRQPFKVCEPRDDCPDNGLEDPVQVHEHPEASALMGGYVYRGALLPELDGVYVYGDYKSGRIWGLFRDGDGRPMPQLLAEHGPFIYSFAEDEDGELYILARHGSILRLEPRGEPTPESVPLRLSDLSCVDPGNPRRPGEALIPYDVNVPFWSEGAEKERYIAVPDGESLRVLPSGQWWFPVGTVLLKHFRLRGRLVETRLLTRHGDGRWGAYSYEWDDRERDATLLDETKTKRVEDALWTYPSRQECMTCHTEAAGYAIGLETAQMNREFKYAETGRTANQLATFAYIGLLQGLPAKAADELPALSTRDAVSVDWRARSYLHANCAYCHQPGGGGMGSSLGLLPGAELDLRYSTPLEDMGLCLAVPAAGDLGGDGALLLVPGDPERSILSYRIQSPSTATGMPPIGKQTFDREGRRLINRWIESLSDCR